MPESLPGTIEERGKNSPAGLMHHTKLSLAQFLHDGESRRIDLPVRVEIKHLLGLGAKYATQLRLCKVNELQKGGGQ
jgi:hypothetical protein